jgi:hypothetical protein
VLSVLRRGIVLPAQMVVSDCMRYVDRRRGHTPVREPIKGAHALLERANLCRTMIDMLYICRRRGSKVSRPLYNSKSPDGDFRYTLAGGLYHCLELRLQQLVS